MIKFIMLFVTGISMLFAYEFYSKDDDIKIGFVAGLSGKYSHLGHGVLNGMNLAFDEIKYKINDETIALIKKDDNQNSDKALNIINYFKNEKFNLVIGNTTSSMTKVSLDIVNKEKEMILFSPTASSNDFSNKDDNFLRVQSAQSIKQFDKLVKYFNENKITNLFIIYDPENKSYSNNYINNFKASMKKNKAKIYTNSISINEGFQKVLEKSKKIKHDAILVVANSLDSAKVIQFLRIKGEKTKIISSGWAKTKEFLENGGKHVENVLFLTTYDNNSKNQKYINFVKNYEKKYNSTPSIFAAQAYESAKIIIEILKKDKDLKNFKSNILEKRVFEGLQGKISFNKFGDVHRDSFLMEVKENNFIRLR